MSKSLLIMMVALVLVSWLIAVSETEPNSTYAESGVLLVENGIHDGMIMPGDDRDFWAFESLQGDTVTVSTCNITQLDTKLWIYNTDGVSQMAFGDDNCDVQSTVSILTPTDGVYYFVVGSYSDHMGLYQVSLSGASTFVPPGHPDLATNPSPVNDALHVPIDGDLNWLWGSDTETYDLWLGPLGNMVEVVTGNAVTDTVGSYTFSNLIYETEYEWQLVMHNSNTRFTTDGTIWSFTTRIDAITDIPWEDEFASWPPNIKSFIFPL